MPKNRDVARANLENLYRIFTVPEARDSTLGSIDQMITADVAGFLQTHIVAIERNLEEIEADFSTSSIPEEPTYVSEYTEFVKEKLVAQSVHTAAPAFIRGVFEPRLMERTGETRSGRVLCAGSELYARRLRRDNVELVTANISEITPTGIRTADGMDHDVDVIVFGTGFRATEFLSKVRIVGRQGCVLSEFWAGDARAHLGAMVPNFPNFFMLYGPNTNIVVNGSIIMFSECAIRYILSALQLLAERGASSLEVRPEVFEAFNQAVDERNAGMAWGAPEATNWYKNAAGRVSQNWPFPIVDYWYATREAQPDDLILYGEKSAVQQSATTA